MPATGSIGNLTGSLTMESAAFIRDLGKAAASVDASSKRMQRSMAGIERGFALVNRAAGALVTGIAVTKIAQFTAAAVNNAAALHDQAAAIGLAASDLQAYRLAGSLAGVGTEQLDRSMGIFVRTVGQAQAGMGPLTAGLKTTNKELLAQVKAAGSTGEAMEIVLEAIRQAPNDFERARLAQLAFGRGGLAMSRLAVESSKEARDEYKALGIVIRDDVTDKADELVDSIGQIKEAFTAGFTNAFIDQLIGQLGATNEQLERAAKLGGDAGAAIGRFAQDVVKILSVLDEFRKESDPSVLLEPLTQFRPGSPLDILKTTLVSIGETALPNIKGTLTEIGQIPVNVNTVMAWLEEWSRGAQAADTQRLEAVSDWLGTIAGQAVDLAGQNFDKLIDDLVKINDQAVALATQKLDETGLLEWLGTGWEEASTAAEDLAKKFDLMAKMEIVSGTLIAWLRDHLDQALRLVGLAELTIPKPPETIPTPAGADTSFPKPSPGIAPRWNPPNANEVKQTAIELDGAAKALGSWNVEVQDALGRSLEHEDLIREGTNLYAEMQRPMESYASSIERLSVLQQEGAIDAETFARAHQQLTLGMASNWLGAAGAVSGALAGMFRENKAFAIANVVINTAEAIVSALKNPPGPPFSYVYAAAAAATGAAQLAAIVSAKPGGGSVKSSALKPGKSPSTSSSSSKGGGGSGTKLPEQQITINIVGEVFGPDHFRKIVDGINGVQRDGKALIMVSQ